MNDLQLLTPPPSTAPLPSDDQAGTGVYQTTYMIAESTNIDVLAHQLRMLGEEHYDNQTLIIPAMLLGALEEWVQCDSEPHFLESFRSMVLLLSQLCVLENKHASKVKDCRQRDGVKGREVIPDYDAVNAAGGDCMSDPIVKYAIDRAAATEFAVAQLQSTT